MNNIIVTLTKFFKNKNVVTVLGVVLIMAILYFGYNMQLSSQTNPQKVPVAKTTIQPRTLITSDMIETIKVPAIAVQGNVLRKTSDIIDHYTNINTVIPQGSMFYKEVVIDKESLPDSSYTQVKEGEIPYNFPVTMNSTYGNTMFPGNKIDLYMKAVDDSKQVMVGKLIENVEILAVRDNNGRDVFENTSDNRTPAYFIFGVSEEIHILLRKAQYMRTNDIEIFPVPHGASADTEGKTKVSTQYLKEFINSKTVNIPTEDIVIENTGE